MTVRVLFVCLGNICRSPTAHAVFRKKVAEAGLAHAIDIDSCGTSDWHISEPPDKRSMEFGLDRGYDMSDLRARQLSLADFDTYHYILAMDRANLRDILALAPVPGAAHISLFLDYRSSSNTSKICEVPDPYFGGKNGFLQVLTLVEAASEALLEYIVAHDLVQ